MIERNWVPCPGPWAVISRMLLSPKLDVPVPLQAFLRLRRAKKQKEAVRRQILWKQKPEGKTLKRIAHNPCGELDTSSRQ